MHRQRLYFFSVALAALAAGIWLAQKFDTSTSAPPAASALWQQVFPDVRGTHQPLAQWQGQTVVLNFWASWCAPCREELPDFAGLRAQFQPRGVEFIGIAIDKPDNVALFLQRHPVNFPILVGGGAAHGLARQLGNPSGALPYTIVLDRSGNIALSHLGRLPRATLEATLRQIDAQL